MVTNKILTVNVVSIRVGEKLLPFGPPHPQSSPFLPVDCPLRELGEVDFFFFQMEGDYFDGIPACVIY